MDSQITLSTFRVTFKDRNWSTSFLLQERGERYSSPSGSIKGDVKKKHSSSSARRGCFSDIQPPSTDARILAEAQLGRTDFAGGCGIMN